MSAPPLPPGPPPGPPRKKGKRTVKSDVAQSNVKEKTDAKSNEAQDDGWEHYYDDNTQRYFFYNRLTKLKQWLNPRVPWNDTCNRDLPKFPPPDLPFEEPKDEYTKRLRQLKEDSEFIKLPTFEKYKRVDALKKELEQGDDEVPAEYSHSVKDELKEELKEISPFSEKTNFHDTGSTSHFANDLNTAIRNLNATDDKRKHKVSKKQVNQYNNRKKEQKKKKMMQWLTKD
jgi:hypothetical protein